MGSTSLLSTGMSISSCTWSTPWFSVTGTSVPKIGSSAVAPSATDSEQIDCCQWNAGRKISNKNNAFLARSKYLCCKQNNKLRPGSPSGITSTGGSCSRVGSPPLATLSLSSETHLYKRKKMKYIHRSGDTCWDMEILKGKKKSIYGVTKMILPSTKGLQL